MGSKYVNVCILCGQSGGSHAFPGPGGGPPVVKAPPIIGRCQNSSDGKHKPKWELM